MRRAADWLMACIAAAVVVLLGAAVLPNDAAPPARPDSGNFRAYHPGKNARTVPFDSGCIAEGCHPGAPHKRGLGLAPFRNMHAAYVDCPVCHAPDGMSRIAGSVAGSGRHLLKYAGGKAASAGKGHPPLGSPAGCRRCHSDAGAGALKARGVPSLPSNFNDPIALRMQEGGARRWNP
jgi:hypothetical protein